MTKKAFNWKGFLKPTKWKILLAILLIYVLDFQFSLSLNILFGNSGVGFPLAYNYIVWASKDLGAVIFNPIIFVVDIIFWYLISVIIITVFERKGAKK